MRKRSRPLTLEMNIWSRLDLTSPEMLVLRDTRPGPKEYARQMELIGAYSPAPERLLRFLSDFDGGFYRPEKCDVYQPIRETFNPDHLVGPIRWVSHPAGRVMVKKIRPFRFEGFVENMRHDLSWNVGDPEPRKSFPDPLFKTEWCLWLRASALKLKPLDDLLSFLRELYLVSEGDFGFLAMEGEYEEKNYLISPFGDTGWISHKYVGDTPEFCIPGVYFATIFGKVYTDWFGREKCETVPCHKKEWMRDGSLFVQTAPNLDYYSSPDDRGKAEAIIDHFGREAFFDINNPNRVCAVPDEIKRQSKLEKAWWIED